MVIKRLITKRINKSLAIDDVILSRYCDQADYIVVENKEGKFRIAMNDLVLEGKKRQGKWTAPKKYWEFSTG